MNKGTASHRRGSALSRGHIIEEAIALLDESGEQGLTFRALSERLATGAGAIYWHIHNKRDLLISACDAIIARTVDAPYADVSPEARICMVALGVFDAMDAHPWVGAALARAGGELPVVRILESLGQQVRALGVHDANQWSATSALMSYILGVGGQNAAHAQLARQHGLDRMNLLTEVSQAWSRLDPDTYPFTRSMSDQLPIHDDRADFLAGIELILSGIRSPNKH